MLLCDHQIRRLAKNSQLLDPFSEGVQDGGVVSYGLTSAGYDLRLGHTVKVFKNTFNEIVSPKILRSYADYENRVFDTLTGLHDHDSVLIPPHSYILAYSLERIKMPCWLKGRCVGKSTYARCGLILNCTPLEPEWEGHLTLEIANASCCPVSIYVAEGIAQLEFEMLDDDPEQTYAGKTGKYQNQGPEPVTAKVKK